LIRSFDRFRAAVPVTDVGLGKSAALPKTLLFSDR
jgi:hypothetical protein